MLVHVERSVALVAVAAVFAGKVSISIDEIFADEKHACPIIKKLGLPD